MSLSLPHTNTRARAHERERERERETQRVQRCRIATEHLAEVAKKDVVVHVHLHIRRGVRGLRARCERM